MTQDPFELIWQRFPERQKSSSSTWWFFLLFPKQNGKYGPKQIMCTIVGIVDDYKLNHVDHKGFGTKPIIKGDEEHFPGMVQGWFFDGKQMHRDIFFHSCPTVLSSRSIAGWVEQDGIHYGGQIEAGGDRFCGVRAKFVGSQGKAQFEAWGDPDAKDTAPDIAADNKSIIDGSHVITWRRLNFAGNFSYPGGSEQLEGIGYFQRVCLNLPPMPWKWIWVVFEDQSIFSCFIPYAGLHLFRRGDRLFPKLLEQATIPLKISGYFYRHKSGGRVEFDSISVTPIADDGIIHFDIKCSNANGDFINFRANSHSHMQNLLDRPVLGGLWHSRYNYNEFLFRVADLEGSVSGEKLEQKHGYGNCEYTWGLGLHF